MIRRVTYKTFQREDALVGAFLRDISENYLGAIAKQYVDHVIVRTSGFLKGKQQGWNRGKSIPSLLNKMII